MQFSTNSPILFLLVGAIIAAVLAQSVFFLVKALRRARALGMDMYTPELRKLALELAPESGLDVHEGVYFFMKSVMITSGNRL